MDNYIADLDKTNPKLSQLISKIWQEAQTNTQDYMGQSIALKLDEMIDLTIREQVVSTARDWCVEKTNSSLSWTIIGSARTSKSVKKP